MAVAQNVVLVLVLTELKGGLHCFEVREQHQMRCSVASVAVVMLCWRDSGVA